MKLKINEADKLQIVGFNNSAAPLGYRDDILDLAILARRANDSFILGFFENVPELDELLAEKAKSALPEIPVAPVVPVIPASPVVLATPTASASSDLKS